MTPNATYPLPSGWSVLSQTATNVVFTSNLVMSPGDSITLILDYVSNDTVVDVIKTFVMRIANGAGGETNVTNNLSQASLLIRMI